jgi:hypothetical protein
VLFCHRQLARLAEAAVSCTSGAFSRAFAGDAAGGAALLSARMAEELDAVTPADLLQVMQRLQPRFETRGLQKPKEEFVPGRMLSEPHPQEPHPS